VAKLADIEGPFFASRRAIIRDFLTARQSAALRAGQRAIEAAQRAEGKDTAKMNKHLGIARYWRAVASGISWMLRTLPK